MEHLFAYGTLMCADIMREVTGCAAAAVPAILRGDGGETLAAQVYEVHPTFRDRLDSTEWDFDAFLREGKQLVQAFYKGYHAL